MITRYVEQTTQEEDVMEAGLGGVSKVENGEMREFIPPQGEILRHAWHAWQLTPTTGFNPIPTRCTAAYAVVL